MTVRSIAEGRIALEGDCASEDAEILLRYLSTALDALVDLRACESAHTAVIQVLMAAKPELLGPPAGSRMKEWIYPVLRLSSV